MSYDPNGFYPMGYDHRGMPVPMHGGYEAPVDMYFPQPTSSQSSRSRNTTDVNNKFYLNKIIKYIFIN
jgi:hypothetical protein